MYIKSIAKKQFKLTDKKLLSEYITDMAWSPHDNYLAIVSAAGELALWQAGEIDLLNTKGNYSLDCLRFSVDGQWLAVAGQKGEVRVWRSRNATFQLVTTLNYDRAWIDSLAWNPQQNLLALAVNRQIKIWDGSSQRYTAVKRRCLRPPAFRGQKIIASLDFKDSSIFNLGWHPQGSILAASGHGGVKVWQSSDWAKKPYLLKVPGASLDCAWSFDGRYLASKNLDRTISLLDWGQPPPLLMQGFPGKVSWIAWSQNKDKPLLAAACQEGIIIWQYNQEKWHSYVLKHQKLVQAIAFSPNSFLLASTGDDNCVRLWQREKLIQSLTGVSNGFSCLAWHPTGQYLTAGGQNGEVIIYQECVSGKGFGHRTLSTE